MINLKTIYLYLLKLYCRYFLIIFLILVGIFAVCNVFDVLHKFKSAYIPSNTLWKLVLYKIPYLLNETMALLSFVAMLFFLKNLTQHNELITLLCNGMSIWRVISMPVFIGVIFGISFITILNPIGAYGLKKYEQLEVKLTKKKQSSVLLIQSGVLLREEYDGDDRIIKAGSVNLAAEELQEVTILFIGSSNNFLKRIDAPKAILKNGNIELREAKITNISGNSTEERINIPTSLSVNNFTDSFKSPEMMSILELKATIKRLIKSGIPVVNYQIYYYKQIFKPLVMAATIIFACNFFSLSQRNNAQLRKLFGGLLIGLFVYSAMEIATKILAFYEMQPIFAVLAPILLILFISNFVILHLHEA